MKLPENVKVKPWPWTLIPWMNKKTAQAIYPNIYFPKEIYRNLNSPNPETKYIAALIHEQEHIKRQKNEGLLKWGMKYVFSPKFRFNEELEAIKASTKYLKKKQIPFDSKRVAKILSGWLYLWPVSYKTAKKELEKIWGEI